MRAVPAQLFENAVEARCLLLLSDDVYKLRRRLESDVIVNIHCTESTKARQKKCITTRKCVASSVSSYFLLGFAQHCLRELLFTSGTASNNKFSWRTAFSYLNGWSRRLSSGNSVQSKQEIIPINTIYARQPDKHKISAA